MPELSEAECLLVDLRRRLADTLCEMDGYRKAYELMQKGMESQAELMDGLKQEVRRLRAVAAAAEGLREALKPFARRANDYALAESDECGAMPLGVTVGDYRRVPAALAAYDAAKGGKPC